MTKELKIFDVPFHVAVSFSTRQVAHFRIDSFKAPLPLFCVLRMFYRKAIKEESLNPLDLSISGRRLAAGSGNHRKSRCRLSQHEVGWAKIHSSPWKTVKAVACCWVMDVSRVDGPLTRQALKLSASATATRYPRRSRERDAQQPKLDQVLGSLITSATEFCLNNPYVFLQGNSKHPSKNGGEEFTHNRTLIFTLHHSGHYFISLTCWYWMRHSKLFHTLHEIQYDFQYIDINVSTVTLKDKSILVRFYSLVAPKRSFLGIPGNKSISAFWHEMYSILLVLEAICNLQSRNPWVGHFGWSSISSDQSL